MKVRAKLNFITLQTERTELTCDGYAETDGKSVRLSFETDTYAMQIETDGTSATVVRSGENAYTLSLHEARATQWTIDGMCAEVYTDKLRLRQSEHRICFMAQYRLGGDKAMQVIVTANF